MARGPLLPALLALTAVYGASLLIGGLQSAFVTPMSRRQAMQGVAGAVATTLGVQAAHADWQGEPAKALNKYLPAVVALGDSIAKGDMKAVVKKERKFQLLNTFWRNSPAAFKVKSAIVEDLVDAAAEGKVDEVKKLYAKYMDDPIIKTAKAYPKGPTKNVISTWSALVGVEKN